MIMKKWPLIILLLCNLATAAETVIEVDLGLVERHVERQVIAAFKEKTQENPEAKFIRVDAFQRLNNTISEYTCFILRTSDMRTHYRRRTTYQFKEPSFYWAVFRSINLESLEHEFPWLDTSDADLRTADRSDEWAVHREPVSYNIPKLDRWP